MGSPVDLTLGCSTQAAPSSTNGCRGPLDPGDADYLESLRQAEAYLQSLQDERLKVEGFKRELPLCIELLESAIQSSKEKVASDKRELQQTRSCVDSEHDYSRPRLEEFMPLSRNLPLKRRWEGADAENEVNSDDGDTEGTSDRASKRPAWMAKALLWTQASVSTDHTRREKEKETEQFEQEQSSVSSAHQQLLLTSKERPTGAFLPFLPATTVSRPVPRTSGGGMGLSLSFGEPLTSPRTTLKTADSEVGSIDHAAVAAAAAAGLQTPDGGNHPTEAAAGPCNGVSGAGAGSSSGGQSQRKARRCWSPELHRRFVNALHQLGGSQIATPKQIRELMKVDGLTNDEVKSHLQKYRLHTRRPSPTPPSAGVGAPAAPQLVVLGGIWVPPKSSGVYDSSQPQSEHSLLPQDASYFACLSNGASPGAPMDIHHHHQSVFEPQQAASQSQCSPQGPSQLTSQLSGGTQGPSSTEVYHEESEEEEEAKSDSTSGKHGIVTSIAGANLQQRRRRRRRLRVNPISRSPAPSGLQ